MSAKKANDPKVSIILPAYNAELFIRESLDSILRQSFKDFEVIALNDGSTDSTPAIIDEYAKRDARIIPVHQKNIGLVATLNKGILQARGTYIARIDGDDPWIGNKLEEQIRALEEDPTIVLIGCGFEITDINGFYLETVIQPLLDEDIRRTFYLRNAFGHSGVVFKRSSAIEAGLYSDKYGPTEDYDLWIRLSKLGSTANLAKPAYRYRVNLDGISQQNSQQQTYYSKIHSEKLWSEEMPRLIGATELRKRAQQYLTTPKIYGHGVLLKNQYLADNAQIGIKMIRRRKYGMGIKQLFFVCLTGRTGIRAVYHRFKKIDAGSLRQSRDTFVPDN